MSKRQQDRERRQAALWQPRVNAARTGKARATVAWDRLRAELAKAPEQTWRRIAAMLDQFPRSDAQ